MNPDSPKDPRSALESSLTALLLGELPHEEAAALHQKLAQDTELAALYERRGMDPTLARDLVEGVMQNPEVALEVHAREELGIDPASLGSPWLATFSSFGAFALGAVLPLLPWLFSSGTVATLASIVIGACAALLVGVGLASLTGRSRVRSALRQGAVAMVAAGVTYGIGRGVGVGLR